MGAPKIKLPNYSLPRARRAAIANADAAQVAGKAFDDPDMPAMATDVPYRPDEEFTANIDGIYEQAKEAGIVDPLKNQFQAPSYRTPQRMTIGTVKGKQPASISKFTVDEGMKWLHGEKTADEIQQNFSDSHSAKRFAPFAGALTDPKDPSAQFRQPVYAIRGEASPKDANGFFDGLGRYFYAPRAVDEFDPDTLPHEFYHAFTLNNGLAGPLQQRGNEYMSRAYLPYLYKADEKMVQAGTPDDDIAYTQFDLQQRYNPWSSDKADASNAHKEWVADLGMWSHDMSGIRGGDRNKAFLEKLFEDLLNETPPGQDPVFQHGPRAGQPAHGHSRRQRSLHHLLNGPEGKQGEAWREIMLQNLLDNGSTQDGHPKYPNA